jgi:hypothetical protein
MKQQGPIAKAPTTSSEARNPNSVRAGLNQSNKPGAGRVTGTMGRSKPSTPARVTSGKPQSPRLPNLPKNPVKGAGTTNTIRATGGRSTDPKINRLSAQASKPTPSKPVAPKAPAGLAKVASTAMSLSKITPAGVAYAVSKARPVANGELAYNQKLAASIMKKKKAGK